ncbi:hypothetical protein HWV62_3655 [Athelia sp. TMB]|nr:hypothetical protein HWV62_3655 [Athelia sp. TMB]
MSDPIATARSDFDVIVPGTALFFNNGYNKALRVECPTIALEFTDGLYIGQDPNGFLFYNAIDDFKMTKDDGKITVVHHYKILKTTYNSTDYVTIEYRRDSDTDCYAKAGTAAGSDMVGHDGSGDWVKLAIGSALVAVEKESANQKITLYANPIDLKAVWTDSSDYLKKKGFNVDGNLYFKKLSDLSSGVYANYNNDRIVFYKDNWTGTDFVAYFIPLESETESLDIKPTETKTFEKIAWSKL